jgi:hypothetical protein
MGQPHRLHPVTTAGDANGSLTLPVNQPPLQVIGVERW